MKRDQKNRFPNIEITKSAIYPHKSSVSAQELSSIHSLTPSLMSLFIANGYGGGARILCNNPAKSHSYTLLPHRSSHLLHFTAPSPREPSRHFTTLVVSASKKFTPRTGRFDSNDKRGSSATTTTDRKDEQEIERVDSLGQVVAQGFDDGFVVPKLPGEETDFWEGPQWDGFGFFVQYMWAFGILFALIACGIAVATYNEGASDFKETPAYKESVQTQGLLEEPDTSNPDVFESNPTEVAPSLE